MTTDNFCFYLQTRLIQTGQTGGQLYSVLPPQCSLLSLTLEERAGNFLIALKFVNHVNFSKISYQQFFFLQNVHKIKV